MAGDSSGENPVPGSDWVSLFKDLETTQFSHVFDGLCSHCISLLQSNLINLLNHQRTVTDEVAGVDVSPDTVSSLVPYLEDRMVFSPVNTNHQFSDCDRSPASGDSSKFSTQGKEITGLSPSPLNGKPALRDLFGPELSESRGNYGTPSSDGNGLSNGEEWRWFSEVGRKKNFEYYERVNGKEINVLQGLELHTGVFNAEEQKKIVEAVSEFQRMGRKRQLMARTYTEPLKWMRGKGRVTIQFGCCYNYAVDKDGNPPGIVRDEEVDPLPTVFKEMISRMVRWHVLPPTCIPNSCIVNIYDEGDCIPPHIDHHDFLRPFCTVSFLTECNILFGLNLKVSGPGEFSGPVSIPLPVGSVLVLNGKGADVARHCVPAVPAKRISVTFRRMDESKIPYGFLPDPELLNLSPLRRPSATKASIPVSGSVQSRQHDIKATSKLPASNGTVGSSFVLQNDDFPALGSLKSKKR